MTVNLDLEYTNELPREEDFYHLYQTTGWNDQGSYTSDQLFRAVRQSWYTVSCYEGSQLVGFGRVISDGIYQCFICDIIVLPDYQGKRIGTSLTNRLLSHCKSEGIRWVQLSCGRGKKPFYEKLGFTERPSDGPGMQIFLSELK